jgi:transposase
LAIFLQVTSFPPESYLLSPELLAGPAGCNLVHAVRDADFITILVAMDAPTAACPLCNCDAQRVHSRYVRRLADLPCFGDAVRLQFTVRRFRCERPECPRRIFAERLPGFAAPYARTTDRLRRSHEAIGYSLGGEAGSRLTVRLAMTTSADTLLRRVKQLHGESVPSPHFVGIDDWAWRKGQRYGTIVVDLERSEVIDLLPDREGATVTDWLQAHPGIELVSRDRSSTYAQAATEGAPDCRQVADRWHLLKNLREAIERLFERQFKVVTEAVKAAETPPEPSNSVVPAPTEVEETPSEPTSSPSEHRSMPGSGRRHTRQMKRERRVDRFEQVHERRRKHHSIRRIARELGMSRRTVMRYLRCQTCPDWNSGRLRPSRVGPHREWIDARLAEGVTNVVQLHRELAQRGFTGSYGSVWRYVSKRLGTCAKKHAHVNAKKPSVPPPSAKQLSFGWVRRAEARKPAEQAHLDAIRSSSTELAAALDLADEFAALIRKQSRGTLNDWLVRGEVCSNPELRRFAEGIRRDEAAVLAAVTEPWSNGPVEGHVNRLKTIKRQMYGRAGFVLLRARVRHAA